MKPASPSKVVIVPRPPAQGEQTVPESPVAPAQAEEIQAEEIQAEPCQATPIAGPAPASQPKNKNE